MMKVTKLAVTMVTLLAVFVTTALASTNVALDFKSEKVEKWAFTVGGVGLTSGENIGNDWVWGGELGIARVIPMFGLKTEAGLRQSFSYGTTGYKSWTRTDTVNGSYTTVEYVDAPCTAGPVPMNVNVPYSTSTVTSGVDKEDGWVFRSELFWDWYFTLYKGFSVFVGPNASVNYGNITPMWAIGPEAGFRYDFKNNIFLITRVNYDWNLSDSNDGFRVFGGVGYSW